MKKIMLFAAACAALAACNKNIESTTPKLDNPNAFVKGQEVTLTVSEAKTKATGFLNASDGVDFKWDEGDQIKVTVGTESSTFTLKSGAGEATASFEGTMPSGGETFSVQYPAADPDLSNQTYVENGLPKGMMKATASNCTINGKISLTPQYSALRLNLWGSKTVGKIVVIKTETTDPSFTLDCGTGATIGTTKADSTAFFIVVPAGSFKFSAEIFDNSATPASICKFETTDAKTFTAGQIRNMAAKEVKKAQEYPGTDLSPIKIGDVTWAPVNCGYDATKYPLGLLYQWGRKYGQPNTGTITPTDMNKEDDDEDHASYFASNRSGEHPSFPFSYNNWYSGTADFTLWNGAHKGSKDPCPEGWRVPTQDELKSLGVLTGIFGWDYDNFGYWFNGTDSPQVGSGIFFPLAGSRKHGDGSIDAEGIYYWTSNSSGMIAPDCWEISQTGGNIYSNSRLASDGCSVRCVKIN